jgi:uncharacterized protein YuzE
MKIDYDAQADALYIQLREGEVAETVATSQYAHVDLDEAGRPLGIEILFVKRHLALSDLTSITFNIFQAAEQNPVMIREDKTSYGPDED